mmetsp:Transcript_4065/g.10320  ORF Transcript_4065/g.10320 Transcript_4065/m.10320 type:complete len:104 (+) Transcript_4065:896-1207(+)
MLNEESAVKRVYCWHPDETPPLNFISSSINNDVNRSHVSHFPKKEFDEVEILTQSREKKTPIHVIPTEDIRAIAERKARQLPKRHAETAVDESFQINTKDPWI